MHSTLLQELGARSCLLEQGLQAELQPLARTDLGFEGHTTPLVPLNIAARAIHSFERGSKAKARSIQRMLPGPA